MFRSDWVKKTETGMLAIIALALLITSSVESTFTYAPTNAILTESLTFDAECYMNTETIPSGCDDVYTNARDGYLDAEECYTVWPMFDYARSLCGGNQFHLVQTFCESQRAWPGDTYLLKDNELYSSGILYSGCYLPTDLEWVTTLTADTYSSVAIGSRAFTCQSLLNASAIAFPPGENVTDVYGFHTRDAFQVNLTTTDCIDAEMVLLQARASAAESLLDTQDDRIIPEAFMHATMGLSVISFGLTGLLLYSTQT